MLGLAAVRPRRSFENPANRPAATPPLPAGLYICCHLDRTQRRCHHVQQVPPRLPRLPLPHHADHVVRARGRAWGLPTGVWLCCMPLSSLLLPCRGHPPLPPPTAPLPPLPPPLHPHPPARTRCRHMFFCAALAIGLVKSGRVQGIAMDRETYMK